MPLSFGIPLGLLIAVVGAVLFYATGFKKIAKLVVGVGVIIALVTVVLIALAVSSSM